MRKLNLNLIGINVVLAVFVLLFWGYRLNQTDVIKQNIENPQQVSLKNLDGLVELNGNWEFFPDKLYYNILSTEQGEWVSVDHTWDANEGRYATGVATYRILLTDLNPLEVYGLYIQDEASSYRIRVNGTIVLEVGKVATPQEGYQAAYYSDIIALQSNSEGKAEILFEIANYTNLSGGMWHAPIIGLLQPIHHYFDQIQNVEIYLAASMLAIGYIFGLLSTFQKEKRTLYMAFFVLVITVQLLNSGSHLVYFFFPELPGIWTLRMEFMANYLILPIFGLLLESFQLSAQKRRFTRTYLTLIPLIIVFTTIASGYLIQLSFDIFKVVVLIYGAYMLQLVFRSITKNNPGIIYLVIGIVIFAITILFELFALEVKYAMLFGGLGFILFFSVGVVYRFAQLEASHEHLSTEILTDTLTKVGNRQGFYTYMRNLKIMDDERVYILFMDMNKFKEVNDVLGHHVGDEVLRLTSQRIQSILRFDDRLFRFGGDEFVLVTKLNYLIDVQIIIDRLRFTFTEPLEFEGKLIDMSLSIGCDLYEPSKDSLETVIKRADANMYLDKEQQKKQST